MTIAKTVFIVGFDTKAVTIRPMAGAAIPEKLKPGEKVILTEGAVKALPGPDQVRLFNALAASFSTDPVKRFATKEAAARRIWDLLSKMKPEAPAKVSKPDGRVYPLRDKTVAPAKKIFPVRDGGIQSKCLELLRRPGGVHITEFVDAMNALKKGKWTRGNTWSSLVYTLHTTKGYGLKCAAEMLSASGEANQVEG